MNFEKNEKIRILKKMKKNAGDIILHMCTKTHDPMLYCTWDMAHDKCNCDFSFWAIFCTFNPQRDQKILRLHQGTKCLQCNLDFINKIKGRSNIEFS